jgi:hypothetical protein
MDAKWPNYVRTRWDCQDWVHWGLAQVSPYGAPLGLPKSSLAPAYDEVSGGLPAAVAYRYIDGLNDAAPAFCFQDRSSIFCKTACAANNRLRACGNTSDWGLSSTASLTTTLRRTGRQCMK